MSTMFRIDRAVSVHMAHKLATRRPRKASGRVPILMYHGINDKVGSRHPYFETNTSPDRFHAQMNSLVQNGYLAVGLSEALKTIEPDSYGDCKIVITFDDGYADFYDSAFPILLEKGLQATLFIVTSLTGNQRITKNGKQYLTWSEVREVYARGIQIGSHTVTHGELSTMTLAQVDNELRESKEVIEDKLGAPVESFAYPYAFPEQNRSFVQFLRERLQTHGYRNGVSTTIGTAKPETDRYFLPRLPVNTFDDQAFLQAKIEGGYEWLRALQQAKKTMMAAFS